jgi:hypothetical protein
MSRTGRKHPSDRPGCRAECWFACENIKYSLNNFKKTPSLQIWLLSGQFSKIVCQNPASLFFCFNSFSGQFIGDFPQEKRVFPGYQISSSSIIY